MLTVPDADPSAHAEVPAEESADRRDAEQAKRVLVVYATKHGSTAEVAARIAENLRSAGCEVVLSELPFRGALAQFGLVVLGAPIYSGRWLRQAGRFVKRNRNSLAPASLAVFALGPREDTAEAFARSREQLDRSLAKLAIPEATLTTETVFGGVDPPKKHVHRDIRDWAAIDDWCRTLEA